ncbi:MAG: hypothetical protein V2B14_04745 [bacterium]
MTQVSAIPKSNELLWIRSKDGSESVKTNDDNQDSIFKPNETEDDNAVQNKDLIALLKALIQSLQGNKDSNESEDTTTPSETQENVPNNVTCDNPQQEKQPIIMNSSMFSLF